MRALHDAIDRADAKGHLFVVAAGNGGNDGLGENNDATPSYPASYNNPNIIAAAATSDRDTLASFSNFGASSVDLAAPGVNILSTLPNNRYGAYNGTSMATPHITGAAALLKSQDPSLTDEQLKARILQSTDSKGNLQGKVATGGRLNANASLVQTPVSDNAEPIVTSVKPSPKTRDRTPSITATVRDESAELSKSDIRFALDGQERSTFAYDAGTDRLLYNSEQFSVGTHTASIIATDAAGNTTERTWTLKVVRR